ncbi:MAG: folK [Chitinophagaceae bacterium]|nr:folK [Chitinophagaceae bacterium]
MNSVYLLIGGNLGNRVETLAMVRLLVEKELGKLIKTSSIYETASWGIAGQPDFLNQVLLVETKFSAAEIMALILSIENKLGRVRTQKNASRIIDIDILFFNDEIISDPGLTVPHPEIQNRKFALIPMDEIAPGFIHPVFKKSIESLLSTSKDELEVKLLSKP